MTVQLEKCERISEVKLLRTYESVQKLAEIVTKQMSYLSFLRVKLSQKIIYIVRQTDRQMIILLHFKYNVL